MYSVRNYAAMIHDRRRVEAYRKALELTVRPDSVVVDIGTGLGVFAFLACQAGARKVYAIEPSKVISVARELAARNGYLKRIEFIENLSTRISLPERADVIVSDLGGAIPLFERHLPSIADARKRFLKPGGVLIPKADTLWVAVVNAESEHAKIAPPADPDLGLEMKPAWTMSTSESSNARFTEAQLVTEPRRWATLDYFQVDDPDTHAKVQSGVSRPGLGHGVSLWFERTLVAGLCFSAAPGQPETVYGGLFLPWPEPVDLAANETVLLDIRADLRGRDYIFSWNTDVIRAGRLRCQFRQSEFFAEPHSPGRLRKQRTDHLPALNEDGQIDFLILQRMDGKHALEEIAREVWQAYPKRFSTLDEAMGHVARLSRSYSL